MIQYKIQNGPDEIIFDTKEEYDRAVVERDASIAARKKKENIEFKWGCAGCLTSILVPVCILVIVLINILS